MYSMKTSGDFFPIFPVEEILGNTEKNPSFVMEEIKDKVLSKNYSVKSFRIK